jgi:hypothetical protein
LTNIKNKTPGTRPGVGYQLSGVQLRDDLFIIQRIPLLFV